MEVPGSLAAEVDLAVAAAGEEAEVAAVEAVAEAEVLDSGSLSGKHSFFLMTAKCLSIV